MARAMTWGTHARGGVHHGANSRINARVLAMVAALALTGVSRAQTVTWTGAVSNDWFVAGNWSPPTVPGPTSDVVIPAGPGVIAAAGQNVTINTLSLGRELNILGTPTVNSTLTLASATIAAPLSIGIGLNLSGGTYTFVAGGELSLVAHCGSQRFDNVTLVGAISLGATGTSTETFTTWNNVSILGTLTVTVPTRITFVGSQTITGTIEAAPSMTMNGLQFHMNPTGTLTVASGATVRGAGFGLFAPCTGVGFAVVNHGTIESTPVHNATFTSAISLTNHGTIRSAGREVGINGSSTNHGVVEALAGAVSVASSLSNLDQATGTLTGGTWISNGAQLSLPGPLGIRVINPGTSVTIGPSIGSMIAQLSQLRTNIGTLRLATGLTLSLPAGVGLANHGVIQLDPGGSLNISGSGSGSGFTQSAGGTLVVRAAGSAVSQFGRIMLGGASSVASLAGTLNVAPLPGYVPNPATQHAIITSGSSATPVGTFSPVMGDFGYAPLVTYTFNNTVNVRFPSCPVIATPTAPVRFCASMPGNVGVSATGLTPVSYQWEREVVGSPGTWVPIVDGVNAGFGVASGSTTPTVTITGDQPGGTHQLRVVATNSCGSTTSAPITLQLVARVVIVSQPQPLTSCMFSTAEFHLQATGAYPVNAHSWYWDGPTSPSPFALLSDGQVFDSMARWAFDAGGAPTQDLFIFPPNGAYAPVHFPISIRAFVAGECFPLETAIATWTLCAADLDDGSGALVCDGSVDISDLLMYLQLFDLGEPFADIDDGSGTGTPDAGVDISDLLFYLARFDAGC